MSEHSLCVLLHVEALHFLASDLPHNATHFSWSIIITTASFCCSKKVALIFNESYIKRTFDCKRLDTTYFHLRKLGQKPRFSALPPLIELEHCQTWLGL